MPFGAPILGSTVLLYLDPGSGSLAVQALIGGAAAFLLAARHLFAAAVRLFAGIRSGSKRASLGPPDGCGG